MKRIFLIGFLIFLSASTAYAKLVHYTDENGKIHYINTDFSKIPPKYYNQVRSQLEEPKPKSPVSVTPEKPGATPVTNTAIQPPAPNIQAPMVIFLTKIGCQECDKLEMELRAYKIPYQRYDVEYDEQGKFVYEEIGEGDLPACQIGETVIRGRSIEKIKKAIKH